LQHAPAVDARWGLLLTLGPEYRLGQVVRCRRSDYDAVAGTLRIQGSGKKRGTLVQLTKGQLRALDEALGSWLWNLSLARAEGRVADFPLFPGGRVPMRDGVPSLRGVHATRPHMGASHTLRVWLRETEKRAGVEHVPGRWWYGLRRIAVDAAKEAGISREGLQQHGGWSDTQVADRIYAEQDQAWAGKEAADIRAKIRGEG
jgi:integrase